MNRRPMHLAICSLACLFALGAAGCKKKTAITEPPKPQAATTPAPATATNADPGGRGGLILQKVHFELNRAELSATATRTLANDARTLLANPTLRIRVEGHADERGGTEYNLALSERRAATIRTYLMDLGIARDRIETIAYGEERPLDTGHDEESWAANRRGELSVTGSSTLAR